MNRKGSAMLALLLVVFLILLTTFAFVSVFKENLDANRGGSTLNCPGTTTFNATAYNSQNSFEKLTYRPTCFVTGISMSWLVLTVIGASFAWLYRSWRKR